MRRLLRLPLHLYHWRLGWLLGHRFLLLQHTGRVTGLARETVLEVVRYDSQTAEATVMSGFGVTADWFRNLEAGGPTAVVIGRRRFRAAHHVLDQHAAVEALAEYEHRNRLVSPIVHVVLGRLLGWRYRGTETDRRRAVDQLPLVVLSPESAARDQHP